MKVYFARGIDGLTFEEINTTLRKVEAKLVEAGFECINPVSEIISTELSKENFVEKSKQVVESSLKVLQESDIILVDYSIPGRNYVGCTCEIVYAHLSGKPVIVFVGESGNDRRVFLQYHSSFICTSLDEAIQYMKNEFSDQSNGYS